MGGWAGRLLRVDLTSGIVAEQPTSDYERFVGGVGIAAKIYFDEVAPQVDAFDPENPLIVMTGPLAGTPALGSGFTLFYSKSPVGFPVAVCRPSAMGGALAPELKYAGYDGVVITGRAPRPVYLWIEDGKAELRDAAGLWGKDTYETQAALIAAHGRGTQVAAIGPSGERLGRMATIVHKTGHASGISGFGGVMGSKRLKAIAVRGRGRVKVARPEELLELTRRATALIYRHDDPPRMTAMKGLGFPGGSESFMEKYLVGPLACSACPIACLAQLDVPGIPLAADNCAWPGVLAPDVGGAVGMREDEDGWRAAWDINVTVNRLGMSTWESQSLFGFLLHLRDAGLVTEQESGLPLHGDPLELWRALLHQIAYREGIGDVLTEQGPRAAETIGRGADEFVQHTTGWTLPAPWDDARAHPMNAMLQSTGAYLAYADTWAFWLLHAGGYHLPLHDARSHLAQEEINAISKRVLGIETPADPATFDGKAELAVYTQNNRMLGDALPICRYVMHYDIDYYTEGMVGDPSLVGGLYSAVTGRDADEKQLLALGERLFNLDRLQGIKHGYRSGAHDLAGMSDKVFREPLDISPLPGQIVQRDAWLDEMEEYYRLRGWNPQTGVPTTARLEALDLHDEARAIHAFAAEAGTPETER